MTAMNVKRVPEALLRSGRVEFTPAGLHRIVGDAKLLCASDIVGLRALATATEYLRRAVDSLIAVRRRIADALSDESLRAGPVAG